MSINTYKLEGKVWVYPGPAAWYFVTLPKQASRQIKQTFGEAAHGFGSLPVNVTVGNTQWRTSIFPDNKAGAYLLPLKASVRKKEDIEEGMLLSYTIDIQL